ncbi:hypothetical protein JCM11251_004414 [Rhodosporidiobolus azoricus]
MGQASIMQPTSESRTRPLKPSPCSPEPRELVLQRLYRIDSNPIRPVVLRLDTEDTIGDKVVVGISQGAQVLLDYADWRWLQQGGEEEDAALRWALRGDPAVQAVLPANKQDGVVFTMGYQNDCEDKICIYVMRENWARTKSPRSQRAKILKRLNGLPERSADSLRRLRKDLYEGSRALTAACQGLRSELQQQEKNLEFYQDTIGQLETYFKVHPSWQEQQELQGEEQYQHELDMWDRDDRDDWEVDEEDEDENSQEDEDEDEDDDEDDEEDENENEDEHDQEEDGQSVEENKNTGNKFGVEKDG